MEIIADNLGKTYRRRKIFSGVSFHAKKNDRIAITGRNGSGKSTLIRILAAKISPDEGKITFHSEQTEISPESLYRRIAWSGPQIDLPGELALIEIVKLHAQFKHLACESPAEALSILRLDGKSKQPFKYLSSGQQQRLKVGLAAFTESEMLILDEPTSFMDRENAAFVLNLIRKYAQNRVYILASNIPAEYEGFGKFVALS